MLIVGEQVRDGEPLGTVADGVEWALLETIRARNRDTPIVCTGKASARWAITSITTAGKLSASC